MRGETFNDKVFSAFPWTEGNPIGYVKRFRHATGLSAIRNLNPSQLLLVTQRATDFARNFTATLRALDIAPLFPSHPDIDYLGV